MPLVYRSTPKKKSDLAIGSSAMAGGGPAEIPAVRRCSWRGKWLGVTTSSRGIDLEPGLERKHRQRVRSVEHGDSHRCSWDSGEGTTRPGQCVGLGALVRYREETRVARGCGSEQEGEFGGGDV
jgi:hypothetical protein